VKIRERGFYSRVYCLIKGWNHGKLALFLRFQSCPSEYLDPLLDGRRFRATAILSELAARSEFFTRRSIARIG
jgi:hypothetical protein